MKFAGREIICPYCGESFDVHNDLYVITDEIYAIGEDGTEIECPDCGREFLVTCSVQWGVKELLKGN